MTHWWMFHTGLGAIAVAVRGHFVGGLRDSRSSLLEALSRIDAREVGDSMLNPSAELFDQLTEFFDRHAVLHLLIGLYTDGIRKARTVIDLSNHFFVI